jgi:hypothetical protein
MISLLDRCFSLRLSFVLAIFVISACGSTSTSNPNSIDPKTDKLIREGRCRVQPRPKFANPLQCSEKGDCGALPHVQDVRCLYGYCRVGCEEYWGDCNNDYRDGCETPIKRPYYCDGDPRIDPSYEAAADLFAEGPGIGPGRFDDHDFARGIEDQLPQLDKCYKDVLKKKPTLRALLIYKFTLNDDGRIAAQLVKSRPDPGTEELQSCVADIIKNLYFSPGPVGGPVTYTYRVGFIPGSDAPKK